MPNTFGEDLAFLNKHYPTQVLENSEGAKLACIAELQGRTMTSSCNGDQGHSNGYINRDVFERGMVNKQINLFGGEDRIWISPEGGQYSVFLNPVRKWNSQIGELPACIDSESYELIDQQSDSLTYQKNISLLNMSGFTFDFELQRKITLLDRARVAAGLGIELPENLQLVGHVSDNTITNTSDVTWTQEKGLIGLWSVSMSDPSPNAVLIVPYKKGDADALGKIVTADYFGKLDSDRLCVDEELGIVFLRADGDFRSKLGISFSRACSRLGLWVPETGLLSVVDFNLPQAAPNGYTNNLWVHQDEPFAGDVINVYNDGPNESGTKFGGFSELETVSPALALAPGESYTHSPRIVRMQGDRKTLDLIARQLFGASLDQMESALEEIA